ncbi:MAG TPA: hypothetical protein VN729_08295, partial [Ktedonobacteraceae bacterium]|nr:hypothetical protein [Ktedonobacteraceae bacterium]
PRENAEERARGDEREPSPLLLDSGLGKIEVIILRCSVVLNATIKSEGHLIALAFYLQRVRPAPILVGAGLTLCNTTQTP